MNVIVIIIIIIIITNNLLLLLLLLILLLIYHLVLLKCILRHFYVTLLLYNSYTYNRNCTQSLTVPCLYQSTFIDYQLSVLKKTLVEKVNMYIA